MSLIVNVVDFFDSKDNVNTLCRFFSNLADSLLQKLPQTIIKYEIKTNKEYYKQIQNECEDFVLHNVEVTISFEKILNKLDVAKTSGVD